MLGTALAPVIGYDAAAAIAKEAYATGARPRGRPRAHRPRRGGVARLLDAEAMTHPGRDAGPAGG